MTIELQIQIEIAASFIWRILQNKTLATLGPVSSEIDKSDGQINIYAQETPSSLIISVYDNGVGMTSDYLTKLFDISQINLTLGSAEEKGTTLGLLLSKEFVEKHGGKIWIESDKGKGNEIKFTLPGFS